jgi:sec-independent protein translocase protein TatB
MFDIGFWEVAFIGLLALLILGPKRLPEAARSAGQWVGKLRTFITNVKQDLDSQLQSDELAELRRLKDELLKARETLQQTSEDMVGSIANAYDDGMGEQVPGIAPELDFIDDAVSSAPTVSTKQKARRKNGKPAVAKKKETASKKAGKKTGIKKKVSKKKSAIKSKTKKTKTKVKSKKNGR